MIKYYKKSEASSVGSDFRGEILARFYMWTSDGVDDVTRLLCMGISTCISGVYVPQF